jgi:acylphosphatase
MRDGRVEAVFEGDSAQVDKMLAWCNEGSPYSRVEYVEVLEETPRGIHDRFEILYK